MSPRHKRALVRTGLILVACAVPLWFFVKFDRATVDPNIDGFGVVPEFTFNFANQAIGITHYDTLKHLTVVAIVKDRCLEACPEVSKFLTDLKTWADDELRMRTDKKVSQPKPVRFMVQTTGGTEHLPQDWGLVVMEEGYPYLVPPPRAEAEIPAVVLVDDSGFYRAYAPIAAPESMKVLHQELSRMVSEQYLTHYVTEQNLMWEKYRPRR